MGTIVELIKSDAGSISGIAKSKKYGLTVAFASACLAFLSEATSPVIQVALIAAATLAVLGYVVSQSIVEAQAAKLVELDSTEIETTPKA